MVYWADGRAFGGRAVTVFVAPKEWDPDQDDRLVCQAVFDETRDIRTFVFAAPEPRRFRYDAGQFINIEVDIGGETHVRSYTLSSSPTRPERVAISVKRIPGGIVSGHLHDHLKPGDALTVSGPLGEFSTARAPAKKYLFLSAGVGITPLIAMARAAHDRAETSDILFLHCTRDADDIAFHAELELIARRSPAFHPAYAVSAMTNPSEPGRIAGRLTFEGLQAICSDLAEREIFCCGPEGFMAAIRDGLKSAGLGAARYHEESFTFSEPDQPETNEATGLPTAPQVFQVTFAKRGQVISCAPDTTILAATRLAGIPLPSSCAKGLCGTCKSRKISGEVEMKHQGGIRQREIENGLVLLCCSKPLSDVTIDR